MTDQKKDGLSKLLFIAGLVAGSFVFGLHSLIRYINLELQMDYLNYITVPLLILGAISSFTAPYFAQNSTRGKLITSILGVVITSIVWGTVYGVCAVFFGYPLMGPAIR